MARKTWLGSREWLEQALPPGDADAELVEAQHHGLALPLVGQAVDDVGEEVAAARIHLHRGLDAVGGGYGRVEAVAQGAQAGGLLRLGLLGRLQGATKPVMPATFWVPLRRPDS